jgi:iron complex transport system ATP-binding protein
MLYTIRELTFSYAGPAVLRGIDLEIAPGSFVSLIGPNGAGKSTLLKLMAGLLGGFSGAILFGDRPVGDYGAKAMAQKVAFVPQETHVVFPFTAAEMILMGRHASRQRGLFDTEADGLRTREVMALTETEALADRPFNELSGGERQRVVLASALAQDPEVLLLDEPTVYLDLRHQIDFYQTLARLNRDGMTILAVTHDVNLAARYADRLLVLDRGSIARDGRPEDVLSPELFRDTFGIGAHILPRPEGGKYVIPTA